MNREKLNEELDRLKSEFDIFKDLEYKYNPLIALLPERICNQEISLEDKVISFKWYNENTNALLNIHFNRKSVKIVFKSDRKDFKCFLRYFKPKYSKRFVIINKQDLINILHEF